MSPSIEDVSEDEQHLDLDTRPEDSIEFRGSVGYATFSGHLDERGGVNGFDVEVFGWCLEIRRSERGVCTYDSRLRISRIDPVINFESVSLYDCRFTLCEGHGRRIEGQGRIVNFGLEGQELEIEAHSFSIHSPDPYQYGIHRPTFTGFDFGKGLEKPNKKAEALLLSVLDKEQKSQYREEKRFRYTEQVKQRFWLFRFKYHYPVQYKYFDPASEFLGLCIDLDQETPTEDILLICYLEVKGGRGDALIKAGLGGWSSVPPLIRSGRRPSDPVPEPPRRPSAIAVDGVEDRETCTHAVDRSRLNRERLFQTVGDLVTNTERLTRSMSRATENLQTLRRVLQYATVGGMVSCNQRMYDWVRENISQANFMPEGDRIASVCSLFGMNVIVDPNQREPIRIIDAR